MQINRNKIKGLMAEHGDTHKSLAKKLGVSRNTVTNYLTGASPITLDTANRIAKIYAIDPFELLAKEE